MSYDLLREHRPKARKDYKCIWCGEPIPKGSEHYHEISIYCGEFQNHRWHFECIDYFHTLGEEEFSAWGNERPATTPSPTSKAAVE